MHKIFLYIYTHGTSHRVSDLIIFQHDETYSQRILCIKRTVKNNYNSSISTVRIQLHVSALYVGHLQVEI